MIGGTPGHQNPLRGFQTPLSESASRIPDPPALRGLFNSLPFSMIIFLDENCYNFPGFPADNAGQ